MKLNKWSVVKTADAKGLALKPLEGGAQQYEVCVALRNGVLEVSIHKDCVDEPLLNMGMPIKEKRNAR